MQRFNVIRTFFGSIVGLSALVLIVSPPLSFAQPPAGAFPADAGSVNGGNEIIEVEGTYQGSVGQLMQIKREDGTEVYVQLPSDPLKLHFRASPDPNMIQPGLAVRFEADFGPNGLPTAPVGTVEIIRPINAPRMSQPAKEQLTPGVYPLNRRAGNPRQQAFVPGPHRVVGILRGTAQGMMAVAAGNTPIQTQLAEDVDFQVHFNTLELAQAGDEVTVRGFYQPPDETKVRADTVEVTTERVIGEAQAKPKRRSRRSRRQPETEVPPAAAEAAEDDPFAP